jgi:hypothetical protein
VWSLSGLRKLELFNDKGYPDGSKFCNKCNSTGKRPYTLHEKITIAKLSVSKSGYLERYEPFELIAEAFIENWENCIRQRLARSFRIDESQIEHA